MITISDVESAKALATLSGEVQVRMSLDVLRQLLSQHDSSNDSTVLVDETSGVDLNEMRRYEVQNESQSRLTITPNSDSFKVGQNVIFKYTNRQKKLSELKYVGKIVWVGKKYDPARKVRIRFLPLPEEMRTNDHVDMHGISTISYDNVIEIA